MGISVWQILIILLIVILLFGTSKLKNIGSDLGSALQGFKKAVSDDEKGQKDADFEPLDKPQEKSDASEQKVADAKVVDAKTEEKQK